MKQLILAVTLALAFATPAAAQNRPFDPRDYQSQQVGEATQVLVIGTPHLSGAPDSFDPAVLEPLLARLDHLLEHQKRFVRDASHQLRTPLAVLKVQVQSAQRGDLPPQQALAEIAHTVDGATRLANQMLALAKVEQLRQEGEPPMVDWAGTVREVALDLAPLIADAALDFELDLAPAPVPVQGHPWALRELVRNLLHNALKHSPPGGALLLRLAVDGDAVQLTVSDDGPGIAAALRPRLMQAFVGGGGAGRLAGRLPGRDWCRRRLAVGAAGRRRGSAPGVASRSWEKIGGRQSE